jgi:hypothetical protein
MRKDKKIVRSDKTISTEPPALSSAAFKLVQEFSLGDCLFLGEKAVIFPPKGTT